MNNSSARELNDINGVLNNGKTAHGGIMQVSDEKNDRITIIMATYNGERYLKDQLDSLCLQSVLPSLLYVSDNGSTDGTLEVLEKFRDIAPFETVIEHHEGPKAAPSFRAMENFMHAIRHVDGDYLLFCDQDDYWLPEKIGETVRAIKAIESDKGIDTPVLVACDSLVTDSSLKPTSDLSTFEKTKINANSCCISSVLAGGVFQGCMMGFNRALLKLLAKGEVVQEMSMHDIWAAMIASSCGVFTIIDKVLLYYRIHDTNTSSSVRNRERHRDGLLKRLTESLKSERRAMEIRSKRAKRLIMLFEDEVDESVRPIVEEFAALYEHNKLARIAILTRYRILRQRPKDFIRELLAV